MTAAFLLGQFWLAEVCEALRASGVHPEGHGYDADGSFWTWIRDAQTGGRVRVTITPEARA